MKIQEIASSVKGTILVCQDENADVEVAFASDLMSDALALIQKNHEKTILITGLCNSQSIRTAVMLDIKTILIVRNKQFNEEEIRLANESGLNVICTALTMFEACGKLYSLGLKNV